MTIGRPSLYTQELADAICEQIAEGKSLRTICRADDMPGARTVHDWLRDKPDFSQQYAKAREDQADFYADEIIALADNAEDVNKARLQIDTRKWVASKLKAKKYGDKVTNEYTGEGGGPIQVEWTIVDPKNQPADS